MKRTKQLNDARGEYSPLVQPYSIVDDKGKQVLPGLIKKVDTLATESKSFITKSNAETLINKVKADVKVKTILETRRSDTRYNDYSVVFNTSLDSLNNVNSEAYNSFVAGRTNSVIGRDNIVLGNDNTVTDLGNKILGENNYANGQLNYVLGRQNIANLKNDYHNSTSYIFGQVCITDAMYSLAAGYNIYNKGAYSSVIGQNDYIPVKLTGDSNDYKVTINSSISNLKLNSLFVGIPLFYIGPSGYQPVRVNNNIVTIERVNTVSQKINLLFSLGTLNDATYYIPSIVNIGKHSLLFGSSYNFRDNSIVIGCDNNNNGADSILLGHKNFNNASSSILLGYNNSNENENDYLFGSNLVNTQVSRCILGRFNELTPGSRRPFTIAQGTSDTSRKDILWSNLDGDIYVKQKLYVAEDKEVATKEDVTTSIDNKFVVTDSIADSDIEEGKIYLIY